MRVTTGMIRGFSSLGSSSEKISKIGIGTYRLASHDQNHHNVFLSCLRAGVRLIDTSSNYNDGFSEVLVGSVIRKAMEEQILKTRSDIHVISKFGYVQGATLQNVSQYNNVVDYNDICKHCIDSEFMVEQLQASLMRMDTNYIDTYLIHNPEHFLMSEINPSSTDIALIEDKRLELIHDRIFNCFVGLEKQVVSKTILSYGISSNSFGLHTSNPYYLPYEDLIMVAKKASLKVHNHENHSFKTIEVPSNVIENAALLPLLESSSSVYKGGNGLSQYTFDNGINLVISRALTCYDESGSWRFADVEYPKEYLFTYQLLINHLQPNPLSELELNQLTEQDRNDYKDTLEASAWLRQLIIDLHNQINAFTSVMHFVDDLNYKIVPLINSKLDGLDEQTSTLLADFFKFYEQAVRSSTGHKARSFINETLTQKQSQIAALGDKDKQQQLDFLPDLAETKNIQAQPLQDYALGYLLQHPHVSKVLVGITKPQYLNILN